MVWYGIAWYGIVLYGIVWYGIVWYGMVLYGIVWYCMVLYGMVLYGIALYGIVLYGIVLYCIVLYCMVLYCIVLYGMVLYGIVLYGIVLYGIVCNYLVLYLGNIKMTVVAVRTCTVLNFLPWPPHGGDTTKLLHAKGLAVPSSPYIVFGSTYRQRHFNTCLCTFRFHVKVCHCFLLIYG